MIFYLNLIVFMTDNCHIRYQYNNTLTGLNIGLNIFTRQHRKSADG